MLVIAAVATGAITGAVSADLPAYRYEALAYLGTRAPEGGALRGAFEPGALGSGGEVAYVVGVGSRGAKGLYLDTPDAIVSVVTPGSEAVEGWRFAERPGSAGGILSPVSMNDAGDLVFAADITREGQTGVGTFQWIQQTGTLSALALPGMSAPGGGLFGNSLSPASIANGGAVAFTAAVPVPGGNPAEGVFLTAGGQASVVVRPGDAVPGGEVVRASLPCLNTAGSVAFRAEVLREGRRSPGIYLSVRGSLTPVAETGSVIADGGVIREVQRPHLDDVGDVVFLAEVADVDGVPQWSVIRWSDGRLNRTVRPGTSTADDGRVEAIIEGNCSLAVNRRGGAALLLRPAQPAGTAGVFAMDRERLWPVALPGSILAGVGELRDVGSCVALNDVGQVAFEAELADGEVALVLATPVLSPG